MTGKDLGYNSEVLERPKYECSPLVEALMNNKVKSKRDKIVKIDKQDKHYIYNPQHIFAKFEDISDFKEMPLNSMHKKLNEFHKKFDGLKKLNSETKKNKDVKAKNLDNA